MDIDTMDIYIISLCRIKKTKRLYREFAKLALKRARAKRGLRCVIISGSIQTRLDCNGHVIMEIDIMGADMRSYIKAGYGRHDLL